MDRVRLTQDLRLRYRVQFNRVFANAHRKSDRYFTVLFRSNDYGHPRLGMAVSRRLDKRATRRNRLKRVIRESFRHYQGRLGTWDVVVIPRVDANITPLDLLRSSLVRHWRSVQAAASRMSRLPDSKHQRPTE